MKKLLALLFCFYIITLTLTPCMDNGNHSGEAMHKVTGTDQTGNNDRHEDCCSPFCTCSCCGYLFETEKTFAVTQAFRMPATVYFYFNPQIQSHYLFSIWEPPKA